jgi:cellobiose phosphorylase
MPAMAWWTFVDQDAEAPPTGIFRAVGAERIGRLYFPLVNEAGMLSWTSPRFQGSPAASHHEFLSPPLTAEDLPHSLIHRDVWIARPNRAPFSLAGYSGSTNPLSTIEAGPGWMALTRTSPDGHVTVRGTLWCPADLNAKVEAMWVQVTNRSSKPLSATVYAAVPMFARSADHIRDHRHVTALLHRVTIDRHGVTVVPTMSFDERGHRFNRTRYHVLAVGPETRAPRDVWGIEEQFLGEGGTFASPEAVWQQRHAPPAPRLPQGREAIGGFRFGRHTLPPNRSASYLLLAGIADDAGEMRRWLRWAKRPGCAARSLAATKTWWLDRIHRVTFDTADRRLTQWLTWVGFQPMLRRAYGNSYLPQFDYGRGGRGWRDLWQDGLAWLLSDPASVRPMLLRHLGGVRIDGSNATIIGKEDPAPLKLRRGLSEAPLRRSEALASQRRARRAKEDAFIADRNNIPRTWMDHGVWPTHTILLYVDQTGDVGFVLQERGYFRDAQVFRCRQQDPGWTEASGVWLRTRRGRDYRGSVLEHLLLQTVSAFFNVGEHNLCRLEGADWNDGLDMACRRGESAAFSAFYAWNLKRLASLAQALLARGHQTVPLAEELLLLLDRLPGQRRVAYQRPAAKQARLTRYLREVSRDVSGRRVPVPLEALREDLLAKYDDLATRIRTQEWIRLPAGRHGITGGGFFNGYYDDLGRRVEGPHRLGLRMTLTGQVFPLMAGIATDEQVRRVIASVNRFLRDPRLGGIRLNTNFHEVQPALGRAFSFAYGEKENGAIFSHMAAMYACALYLRRRAREGRAVWHALYRLATDQPVAKIFPCLPEYFNAEGRGMYAYLTGSASWLILLLLTQVYGIRGQLGDLVIDPQLTRDDFGSRRTLQVHTAFADRSLLITIANPQRLEAGRYVVECIRHDRHGAAIPFTRLPTGGARLARRHLARFSTRQPTPLTVTLTRFF